MKEKIAIGYFEHDKLNLIFLKDGDTEEHLAVVSPDQVQRIENAAYGEIPVESIPGKVNLKYDSIGTLYVYKSEPYISYNYMDDMVECVNPGMGLKKKFKADQITYGVYPKN